MISQNPDIRFLGRLLGDVDARTVAGVAGAVHCQVNRFVGLDSLGIDRSIDGLVVSGSENFSYGASKAAVHMLTRKLAAFSRTLTFAIGTPVTAEAICASFSAGCS